MSSVPLPVDKPALWLTRSKPAAYKSAEVWAKAGVACAISPLLNIVPARDAPPVPPKDAALIFTSSNSVRYFIDYSDRRDHAVFAVGDATAKAAKEAGFAQVQSAAGTSADVAPLVAKSVSKDTPIIHCSGEDVRGRIAEDLTTRGFDARRDIYYASEAVDALPKLDLSRLDYIALYSPKAARALASLTPDLSGVTILSISAAADAELGDMPAARRIADAPNEAAMLALLLP